MLMVELYYTVNTLVGSYISYRLYEDHNAMYFCILQKLYFLVCIYSAHFHARSRFDLIFSFIRRCVTYMSI